MEAGPAQTTHKAIRLANTHFVDSQYKFCRAFGCLLLSNQIYLINLLWKLGLDLKLHYFSIFHEE